MNNLSFESYKGVRDFYPEEYAILNYIFTTWREVLKSYGFEEYTASILEPSELYQRKTSDEIVNEQTYNFLDRGNRSITLRPEMTPTVTRLVARKSRELSTPIKWFSIPNVFRYEQPQRGRLREHWQLNVDMFGVSGPEGEIEIIQIANDIMKRFKMSSNDFVIKINDREILNNIFRELGLDADRAKQLRILIDKKDKIKNFNEEAEKIIGRPFDFTPKINVHLEKVINTLNELGINNIVFDPLLVRGFDYYTGLVFEIFDTNELNRRSIFGGGRYDKLFEIFNQNEMPAVGFGMGDVTVRDMLDVRGLLPKYKTPAPLYVASLEKSSAETRKIVGTIREFGLPVYFDYSDRKIKYKIERANKLGYAFFAGIGEEEIKSDKLQVKNLQTGKIKKMKTDKVAKFIKKML